LCITRVPISAVHHSSFIVHHLFVRLGKKIRRKAASLRRNATSRISGEAIFAIAERRNAKYDSCDSNSCRDGLAGRESLKSQFPRLLQSKHLSDSSTYLLPGCRLCGGAMARARCLTDSSNFNDGSFQSRTNGYTNPVPVTRRGGLMGLTGRIIKL
jgi:hypothetical protein